MTTIKVNVIKKCGFSLLERIRMAEICLRILNKFEVIWLLYRNVKKKNFPSLTWKKLRKLRRCMNFQERFMPCFHSHVWNHRMDLAVTRDVLCFHKQDVVTFSVTDGIKARRPQNISTYLHVFIVSAVERTLSKNSGIAVQLLLNMYFRV